MGRAGAKVNLKVCGPAGLFRFADPDIILRLHPERSALPPREGGRHFERQRRPTAVVILSVKREHKRLIEVEGSPISFFFKRPAVTVAFAFPPRTDHDHF